MKIKVTLEILMDDYVNESPSEEELHLVMEELNRSMEWPVGPPLPGLQGLKGSWFNQIGIVSSVQRIAGKS